MLLGTEPATFFCQSTVLDYQRSWKTILTFQSIISSYPDVMVKFRRGYQLEVVLVLLDDGPFTADVSDLRLLGLESSLHLEVVLMPHDGSAVAARQGHGLSTTFEFTLDLEIQSIKSLAA